ncbi:hypothetical protein [Sphaerisporangium perillae]|uniref:hypothetical protein n=1 Tax=Sphaerisporangium perillae TaxID=2935860 RepID=UPI0020107B27|nr:hypothetical protein [Sphaerisporangium perillae]
MLGDELAGHRQDDERGGHPPGRREPHQEQGDGQGQQGVGGQQEARRPVSHQEQVLRRQGRTGGAGHPIRPGHAEPACREQPTGDRERQSEPPYPQVRVPDGGRARPAQQRPVERGELMDHAPGGPQPSLDPGGLLQAVQRPAVPQERLDDPRREPGAEPTGHGQAGGGEGTPPPAQGLRVRARHGAAPSLAEHEHGHDEPEHQPRGVAGPQHRDRRDAEREPGEHAAPRRIGEGRARQGGTRQGPVAESKKQEGGGRDRPVGDVQVRHDRAAVVLRDPQPGEQQCGQRHRPRPAAVAKHPQPWQVRQEQPGGRQQCHPRAYDLRRGREGRGGGGQPGDATGARRGERGVGQTRAHLAEVDQLVPAPAQARADEPQLRYPVQRRHGRQWARRAAQRPRHRLEHRPGRRAEQPGRGRAAGPGPSGLVSLFPGYRHAADPTGGPYRRAASHAPLGDLTTESCPGPANIRRVTRGTGAPTPPHHSPPPRRRMDERLDEREEPPGGPEGHRPSGRSAAARHGGADGVDAHGIGGAVVGRRP